jgi:Fic-DOC domain mobile mystery protein B
MEYPEGATPLDQDEMAGLKHPHIETRGELDQLEQQNIQDGYNWLTRQRKYKDLLREDFILEMHRRFFGSVWSWAGRFRQSDKNIGIDHSHIAVALRNLLDDARFWVEHGTYGREEFAARFHHRLVSIHPFPNGNGRHARILTDVILENVLGVAPVNWGAGALVNDTDHRHDYIAALRAADQNDYGPLITFVSK